MATTQPYIDVAGVVFANEAAQAERRMLGRSSTEPPIDLTESQGTQPT